LCRHWSSLSWSHNQNWAEELQVSKPLFYMCGLKDEQEESNQPLHQVLADLRYGSHACANFCFVLSFAMISWCLFLIFYAVALRHIPNKKISTPTLLNKNIVSCLPFPYFSRTFSLQPNTDIIEERKTLKIKMQKEIYF
jgi:hypothetical protein